MNLDKKIFLVIFFIVFSIYVFTSDGHRSTSDEDYLQQQAWRIVLQEPDPAFIPGESDSKFKYPELVYPHPKGPICNYGVLCYPAGLIHSVTAVPFVFVNHHLNFITNESVLFTIEDFHDTHYVWWRNSAEPDHTFMELFYSPFFSSLSVAIFFLIARAFKYKISTSLALAFLLGFSTIFFVYSQTSFNNAPSVFFALAGFLYFKKFLESPKILYSTISASFLVFGYMVRGDVIFFIIPMFFFFIIAGIKWNKKQPIQKILRLISFTLPLIIGYYINNVIEGMRTQALAVPTIETDTTYILTAFGGLNVPNIFLGSAHLEGLFGILFSPGAGLFIYVPILFTVFFTFRDFFKREKKLTVLCLAISTLFVVHFSSFPFWEGFTAFSPKYLYAIIPFLLLPLGASIEKRGRKILPIICILGGIGLFFNFVYMIQDVGWFVWGQPGGFTGLMSLAQGRSCDLYICPEITWTFQFSPLFSSISLALNNLQHDLFLLKALGLQYYLPLLISILSIQFYILYRILKSNSIFVGEPKKTTEKNI